MGSVGTLSGVNSRAQAAREERGVGSGLSRVIAWIGVGCCDFDRGLRIRIWSTMVDVGSKKRAEECADEGRSAAEAACQPGVGGVPPRAGEGRPTPQTVQPDERAMPRCGEYASMDWRAWGRAID